MGFKLGRSYDLRFTGAMTGAEVSIRSTPVEVMLRLAGDITFAESAELLAEYVTDWNLDGLDDQPLKVTTADIMANMEAAVLEKVVREWYKAARGVTAPLDPPSGDGEMPTTPSQGPTTSADSSMAEIPQAVMYP